MVYYKINIALLRMEHVIYTVETASIYIEANAVMYIDAVETVYTTCSILTNAIFIL